MADAAQWELTKQRIAFTDQMFRDFIDGLESDLWFRMPNEGVTHVAWQVGHITIANDGADVQRVHSDGVTLSNNN